MKAEVIRIFLENMDRPVSGGELSRGAHLSRQALWKVVEQLRREGWEIEGVPGSGYRVVSFPSHAEYEALPSLLKGPPHLEEISVFKEIDSTNTYLLARAERGVQKALAVADFQTGGRGRMGRSWFSPPGVNVYMSLLFPISVPPGRVPAITLVVGIAVSTVLEEISGVECKVKWPNDVYAEGRKVVGILTEIIAEQDVTRAVVLGIGVNVNMGGEDIPEDLRSRATSLYLLTGRKYPRNRIVVSITRVVYELLDLFGRAGLAPFLEEWGRRSYLEGKRVVVESGSDVIEGIVRGINPKRGFLVIEKGDGTREEVLSGEVSVKER